MGRFAEAVEKSRVDVVPKISLGSGQSGGLIESLLGVLLADKVGGLVGVTQGTLSNPEAEALKAELRKGMEKGTGAAG